MEIEFEEVDWGVANTYKTETGFKIELNKHLIEFPELRNKIIEHERQHTIQKGFLQQRKVDIKTKIKFSNLFPFYKKYPKTFFQQMSPISYKDKTLFFEWSLIFLYTIYLGFAFLIYYLIKTFSKDSLMFWKIIKYIIIIFLIVIIVYYGGKELIKYINEQSKKIKDVPTLQSKLKYLEN